MDIAALKKAIEADEAKLAEKKQQLAVARQEQKTSKITELREAIKDFELVQTDLFDDVKKPRKAVKTATSKASKPTVGVIKYQSPEGGTWTGKGRPPKWIEGKNYDDFLIKA